jgi:hypothetical protein
VCLHVFGTVQAETFEIRLLKLIFSALSVAKKTFARGLLLKEEEEDANFGIWPRGNHPAI